LLGVVGQKCGIFRRCRRHAREIVSRAAERVIDRLLESPRYGEHWGRKWLDLVRYADTNSFERDGVKPNAWRYRDYVIRAFNTDKPYDQFVREQLAGDELPNVTADSITATGFYRLGLWDDEPADPLQAKYDEFDDIVSTTSQVFLGLTINCARCHDHKIDPITQKDYYKLLSFFHELNPYGTRGDQTSTNQVALPGKDAANAAQIWQAAKERLHAELRDLEQVALQKVPATDAPDAEPEKRLQIARQKMQELLSNNEWKTYQKLKKELETLESAGPQGPRALAVTTLPEPPRTFVFGRGNPHNPGPEVQPGYPSLFGEEEVRLATRPEKSSGRRTALANWIASSHNWLAARVIVNRVWQQHFGRGIVRSANNFGNLGTPPTHPELLDWLAAEFMRNGWSLKKLHKLIMLSAVYRLSSAANEPALAADPANQLFWRYDMRRLNAEEIRDTAYVVTGEFNPQMYGPGYYPTISAEVLAGQSLPGNGWGKATPAEQARRSVYIHVKRSLVTPLLSAFDFPDTDSSCEARFVTTQPGQALALLNGAFFHDRAAALAQRVVREAGEKRADQAALAIRLATQNEAREEDIARGLALLDKLESEHRLTADEALKLYCLTVLNRNEALYLE
jgi:hypothetical protein